MQRLYRLGVAAVVLLTVAFWTGETTVEAGKGATVKIKVLLPPLPAAPYDKAIVTVDGKKYEEVSGESRTFTTPLKKDKITVSVSWDTNNYTTFIRKRTVDLSSAKAGSTIEVDATKDDKKNPLDTPIPGRPLRKRLEAPSGFGFIDNGPRTRT